MTERLAKAAQDARYLFQVYGRSVNTIPEAMLVKINTDLVEALEEYRAATGTNLPPVREKLPELARWDRRLGMYIDDVERFSQ